MRLALWGLVAAAALWACGGQTAAVGSDAGGDSTGSSGSSSGGSGSSSGASSSSSGSGSSSGGMPPVNHRPNDTQCLGPAPSGTCQSGVGSQSCSMDSQCADAGPNGRCMQNFGPYPGQVCSCTADTCADDSACPTGRTCACHGSPYMRGLGNVCVPGNCRVDADCGPGGWCSPTVSFDSCWYVIGYYCHTPKDQCVNDSDCTDGGYAAFACDYDTTAGYWSCVPNPGCS